MFNLMNMTLIFHGYHLALITHISTNLQHHFHVTVNPLFISFCHNWVSRMEWFTVLHMSNVGGGKHRLPQYRLLMLYKPHIHTQTLQAGRDIFYNLTCFLCPCCSLQVRVPQSLREQGKYLGRSSLLFPWSALQRTPKVNEEHIFCSEAHFYKSLIGVIKQRL